MSNVFAIIIVDLIIATTILIPVLLVSHCLHNRARIYEEKTGKKPWYGRGWCAFYLVIKLVTLQVTLATAFVIY